MIPNIKLCGMMRECDIEYANLAKPDYVGFIFADTRRKITKQQAIRFRELVEPDIKCVGVFVDAPVEQIAEIVKSGCIELVQLHGKEDAQYIEKLRSLIQVPLMKAVRVENAQQIADAAKLDVQYLLLDTAVKGLPGGTGKQFDWKLIEQAKSLDANSQEGCLFGKPYFLAGGLQLENLEEAKSIQSFGLDISSGIETDGYKDKDKMIEVVRYIKC
ncbi:MAG: phosphoribosylanthranilate isomerase [Wujia sp.]